MNRVYFFGGTYSLLNDNFDTGEESRSIDLACTNGVCLNGMETLLSLKTVKWRKCRRLGCLGSSFQRPTNMGQFHGKYPHYNVVCDFKSLF